MNGSNLQLKDQTFFIDKEIKKTLRLGKYRDGSSTSFRGMMTDVNVWSYALTSHELEKWTSCQVKDWLRYADIGE